MSNNQTGPAQGLEKACVKDDAHMGLLSCGPNVADVKGRIERLLGRVNGADHADSDKIGTEPPRPACLTKVIRQTPAEVSGETERCHELLVELESALFD